MAIGGHFEHLTLFKLLCFTNVHTLYCWSIRFHTYVMFHLNVGDDITRHYKDTIQERLAILVSFCPKFIGIYTCNNNYQNRAWFDNVITK